MFCIAAGLQPPPHFPTITGMKQVPPATIKKLQALLQIAVDLHDGKDFPITRLTTLKTFCTDPDAAAMFALHIAKLTKKMASCRCST